jgi:hypothetical protein
MSAIPPDLRDRLLALQLKARQTEAAAEIAAVNELLTGTREQLRLAQAQVKAIDEQEAVLLNDISALSGQISELTTHAAAGHVAASELAALHKDVTTVRTQLTERRAALLSSRATLLKTVQRVKDDSWNAGHAIQLAEAGKPYGLGRVSGEFWLPKCRPEYQALYGELNPQLLALQAEQDHELVDLSLAVYIAKLQALRTAMRATDIEQRVVARLLDLMRNAAAGATLHDVFGLKSADTADWTKYGARAQRALIRYTARKGAEGAVVVIPPPPVDAAAEAVDATEDIRTEALRQVAGSLKLPPLDGRYVLLIGGLPGKHPDLLPGLQKVFPQTEVEWMETEFKQGGVRFDLATKIRRALPDFVVVFVRSVGHKDTDHIRNAAGGHTPVRWARSTSALGVLRALDVPQHG